MLFSSCFGYIFMSSQLCAGSPGPYKKDSDWGVFGFILRTLVPIFCSCARPPPPLPTRILRPPPSCLRHLTCVSAPHNPKGEAALPCRSLEGRPAVLAWRQAVVHGPRVPSEGDFESGARSGLTLVRSDTPLLPSWSTFLNGNSRFSKAATKPQDGLFSSRCLTSVFFLFSFTSSDCVRPAFRAG